jgi:DNA-binding LacI/PurR family transcriptional regulator
LHRQTLVEQTAEHLCEGFRSGRWSGKLPGVLSLSKELGVSRDTIRESLWLLEKDGVLRPSGAGKSRVIVPGKKKATHRRILRVGLLLHSPLRKENSLSQELVLGIKHGVEASGHLIVTASKAIDELGGNITRVSRVVNEVNADAWIVYGGTREVLEWFAENKLLVLAIGGRFQNLPIASSSSNVQEAMAAAVDSLIEHGHRRVVFICLAMWRKPTFNLVVQSFLDRLSHHGLKPDPAYCVPDWEETPEGLQRLLEALYFATQPTALLLGEPSYALPVLAFLAARGLKVPDQASIIMVLPDPILDMYHPPLARFDMPIHSHVHRAVRWVEAVAKEKADTTQTTCSATFVPAGSIGKSCRSV